MNTKVTAAICIGATIAQYSYGQCMHANCSRTLRMPYVCRVASPCERIARAHPQETTALLGRVGRHPIAPAAVRARQWMLKVAALRNGFTYGKLFHQLEEIVSELLRYLWKIPSDAHQSL